MQTALLVGAVVLGTGACPLMAWIQRRRGRVACCTPPRAIGEKDRVAGNHDLAAVQDERDRVAKRIRALERDSAERPGGA